MTELLSNVQASDYHINGSYNESLAMAVLRYIDTDYKNCQPERDLLSFKSSRIIR